MQSLAKGLTDRAQTVWFAKSGQWSAGEVIIKTSHLSRMAWFSLEKSQRRQNLS